MEPKVELKLLDIISQFKNMALENATFKEKEINKKKLLTLELGFFDINGIQRTMVLVLDKELTLNEYQDIYEQIIK